MIYIMIIGMGVMTTFIAEIDFTNSTLHFNNYVEIASIENISIHREITVTVQAHSVYQNMGSS